MGYERIESTGGVAVHAVLMLTDPQTGLTLITEATPEGEARSGALNRLVPGASGHLVVPDISVYDPSKTHLDFVQPLGALHTTINQVFGVLQNFNNAVNDNQFTYQGVAIGGYNSNSYAFFAAWYIGFGNIQPPAPAPGYDVRLPNTHP